MAVAYIWSPALQQSADLLPSNIGRSSFVHALSNALGLLDDTHEPSSDRAYIVPPDPNLATPDQLRRYHTPAYVESLLSSGDTSDTDTDTDADSDCSHPKKRRRTERHGFEHDCPSFDLLPTYALQVASGTLTACRLLARAQAEIVINWDGGRHHALRNRASGFCYVADIVLGMMLLGKEGKSKGGKKPRVMYLDLDIHYGDGVALAFHSPTSYSTAKSKPAHFLTLSVHHSAPGFFPPPSPLALLPAADTTSPFTLSIPLNAYPSRSTYAAIFPSIMGVYQSYKPDYVILQLGADGLPADPIGQFGNWSSNGEGGMLWVAKKVKEWGVPMLVLGGGGYDNANTARAWAGVTAVMLGKEVPVDVPHHEFFPDYGPGFCMEVCQGSVKDENTPQRLQEINERYRIIASRISSIVQA